MAGAPHGSRSPGGLAGGLAWACLAVALLGIPGPAWAQGRVVLPRPWPGSMRRAAPPARERPPAREQPPASFRVRARVMTGAEWQRERSLLDDGSEARFTVKPVLKQVRMGIKGAYGSALRLKISVDLADALAPPLSTFDLEQPPYLRTAALEYRFGKALRLRAGRFKRPFSQLELRGVLDLPVSGRGLLNRYVIEQNQWGDRALGAMASGRIKAASLTWALALAQAEWRAGNTREGFDVLGRVAYRPFKAMKLGVNGGRKQIRFAPGDVRHGYAYGGDLSLRHRGARALIEGTFAQLPLETDKPQAFGAVLLVSYQATVEEPWAVRPFLLGEYADANSRFRQTETLRLAAGVNVLGYGGRFRLMPQFSWTHPLGQVSELNPWSDESAEAMLLAVVAL